MAATGIDSMVLDNLFSSEAMRRVFSDESRLQRYLDAEAALAAVQARLGVIPLAAVAEIERHSVPITFGYKAAVLLAAIERHRARLGELRPRVLVGEFGGAVGTLAALGPDGLKVRTALMKELGLGESDIAWHTTPDLIAEVACFLGLVAGTLGKIATDIRLLMQTEVGEVFEPFAEVGGRAAPCRRSATPSITLAPQASSSIGSWQGLRKGRSHKRHVLRAARLSTGFWAGPSVSPPFEGQGFAGEPPRADAQTDVRCRASIP